MNREESEKKRFRIDFPPRAKMGSWGRDTGAISKGFFQRDESIRSAERKSHNFVAPGIKKGRPIHERLGTSIGKASTLAV